VDILGKDERWKNLRNLSYTDYMEAEDFSEMVSDTDLQIDLDAIIHMGACSDTTEAGTTTNFPSCWLAGHWNWTHGLFMPPALRLMEMAKRASLIMRTCSRHCGH
jgi:hypothetical protein